MPAHLIVCGDPPVGVGGDFESDAVRELVTALPEAYTLVRSVSLPRGSGAYYEIDALLIARQSTEVIEFKCIRPVADVYEDHIGGTGGFVAERVFSRLDMKAKVLAGRKGLTRRRVTTSVVVPSETHIGFRDRDAPLPVVRTLADTVDYFRREAAGITSGDRTAMARARSDWESFAAKNAPSQRKTGRHLGRFLIRRRLDAPAGCPSGRAA